MKRRSKRIVGRLGALGFRRLQKWLAGKDPIAAERIGMRLGRMAFRLVKSRRERTLSNLRMAFPEKTEHERHDIAQNVFEHFGLLTCDFMGNPKRTPEQMFASTTVDGYPSLHDVIPLDTAVVLATAHFGNWERLARYLVVSGYKLSVVMRDANDDQLNDMVIDIRRAVGVGIIARGTAARAVLTKLKANEMTGILADQNATDAFLPFFGHPCGTVLGPAVLAKRAKAMIVFCFYYRTGPNEYHCRVPAVLTPDQIESMTPEEIMAQYNAQLEAIIREHPEQFLWLHNRWKSARRAGLL